VVSPAEPLSAIAAYYRSRRLARLTPPPEPAPVPYWERDTDDWPDPYGPDLVVFGAVPRVRDGWL